MHYILLDTDSKIKDAVDNFSSLERIAVDFEGEFNLHIYGEHLCLIQVFDGTSFYIIDPRATDVSEKGLGIFFSSPVKKLWFDCQSDISLVYKKYGMTIENIYDVRVLGIAFGFTGNLLAMEEKYLGIKKGIAKKKNQQSNWLKRPLPPEQIEYALEDVAHLMELEDALYPIIVSSGLEGQVNRMMKKAVTPKKPEPGWKKLGGWQRLSFEEKIYAKHIFIARDNLARRFNVPAVNVMDKHFIIDFARRRPSSESEVAKALSGVSPRFQHFIIPAVWKAIGNAGNEIREKGLTRQAD